MKPLKFRAWHFNRLEMEHNVHLLERFADIIASPEKYELMQFTGFYDKKGIEVYEGDIFRVEEDGADDGKDMIYYLVIVWIKEWGMFGTLRYHDEYQKYLIEGAKALDEPMFWTYTLEDTNDRRFYLDGNIYQNTKILSE